ncbi:hypothetical protein [Paraburkholderia fungorum]|uniref:hypothetical protein n=1 Tax=Paraburkholderia fungorum TaxID=134537 RepID=UPI000D06B01C|nr:hypothetical protein [Paraburkholderia fungorum]
MRQTLRGDASQRTREFAADRGRPVAHCLSRSPEPVVDTLTNGVDLGPTLSIADSPATNPWLTASGHEGEDLTFPQFLVVGGIVIPALVLATAKHMPSSGRGW